MVIDNIKGLRQVLEDNIKGQSHVIDGMLPILSREELGLSDPSRAYASLRF